MPQFDKLTFFNQVFYVVFIFFGFYFVLLRFFLPKLSSVLKIRQKKLQFFNSNDSSSIQDFSYSSQILTLNFLQNSIKILKHLKSSVQSDANSAKQENTVFSLNVKKNF